jgi:hypothetical protein
MKFAGLAGALVRKFWPADGIMGVTPMRQVRYVFSPFGLAADAELFYSTAIHGNRMTAGMGQHDHGICLSNGPADKCFLKDKAFR